MQMRTFESYSTVRDRRFDEAAFMTAEHTAMASSINAEEIERWWKLMSRGGGETFLKMLATPKVPVVWFQAASTKQSAPDRARIWGVNKCEGCVGRTCGTCSLVWAACHPFASVIDLITTSWAEKDMSSKHNLLRDFQRFHSSQGHSGTKRPTEGKVIILVLRMRSWAIKGTVASGCQVNGCAPTL